MQLGAADADVREAEVVVAARTGLGATLMTGEEVETGASEELD